MNENVRTVQLFDFMDEPDGWGHAQGRRVHGAMLKKLEEFPGVPVIRISLRGVHRTDASFPRESVVELARRFRGDKGFCLVDVEDPDLLDNWEAAAAKRKQPLLVWNGDKWRLLGPQPSPGSLPMFRYVMKKGETSASNAAKKLSLNLTNASTKLKQLLEGGFALRREETARSGGLEFIYFRIC